MPLFPQVPSSTAFKLLFYFPFIGRFHSTITLPKGFHFYLSISSRCAFSSFSFALYVCIGRPNMKFFPVVFVSSDQSLFPSILSAHAPLSPLVFSYSVFCPTSPPSLHLGLSVSAANYRGKTFPVTYFIFLHSFPVCLPPIAISVLPVWPTSDCFVLSAFAAFAECQDGFGADRLWLDATTALLLLSPGIFQSCGECDVVGVMWRVSFCKDHVPSVVSCISCCGCRVVSVT